MLTLFRMFQLTFSILAFVGKRKQKSEICANLILKELLKLITVQMQMALIQLANSQTWFVFSLIFVTIYTIIPDKKQ